MDLFSSSGLFFEKVNFEFLNSFPASRENQREKVEKTSTEIENQTLTI